MNPQQYLNVDLVLVSPAPLAPLLDHWGDAVDLLHEGDDGQGRHIVVVEPSFEEGDPSPAQGAAALVAAVQGLPPTLHALWEQCDTRCFDFGFQGGMGEPRSLSWELPATLLETISQRGASVRFTLYAADMPKLEPAYSTA